MPDPTIGSPVQTELVATKLHIPPTRPDLVPRTRLIEILDRPSPGKLTLVSAPAGFGKTTLVASWAQRNPKAVAWVSLDAGDNDPVRFWSYLVTALHALRPKLHEDPLLSLHAAGSGRVESLIASLINEIAALPTQLTLVLDDYHLISEASIHRGIDYLLDHLPPQMRLIVATREDPPLSLPRLRVRGQLLELRIPDLRFTDEEAAAFLSLTMGLRLSAEDVAALEARTEGWIAGLQLAALSIQGRQDVSDFVDAFTGSQRFVLDYLADEVFSRQPEETRRFLLQTSILDRLCAPLCDAVTEGTDGERILRELEGANLFLIPLDEERRWYRYHHLFLEFLRSLLARRYADRIPRLRGRASEWLAAHGFLAEALEQALAAGDYPRAASLMESTADDAIKRGEMASLARWLQALPEEYVGPNPRLCLAHAWALFGIGDLERAKARLSEAESCSVQGGTPEDVSAGIAVLHSLIAVFGGDVSQALDFSRQAVEKMPAGNSFLTSMVALTAGFAYELTGDATAASRSYLEATASGQSDGNVTVTVAALAQLGDLQMTRGRLRYAAHLYQQALETGTDGSGWSLLTSAAHVGLARVLLEWNDLEGARHHLEKGARMLGQWGGIGTFFSSLMLAEARQQWGDPAGSLAAMQQAEMASVSLPGMMGEAVSALEARIWLRQGQLERVRGWANGLQWNPEGERTSFSQYHGSTLGRLLLAEGKPREAIAVTSTLIERAESGGGWGVVIDSLAVQALALDALGEGEAALAALRRALSLAEPEGYLRSFVQEGEAMFSLLSRLRDALGDGKPQGEAALSSEYVDRLLATFSSPPRNDPRTDQEQAPVQSHDHHEVPDLLSPRELELLRLLAEGRSTREIAEELFITEGTVKRHLHNIYGKLEARSRTQAIATARRLGILAG
jgi:LuxR family transcriptional regulator, maltose regulon positive regulatory protein